LVIDYDGIRRIHRLERSSSKLSDLSEDFYNGLNDFVRSEREAYLASVKDFSPQKARDFANLKKMVEEIFSLREKKILTKALISSRTKEHSSDGLASHEKKLFAKLLSLLNGHNEIVEGLFQGKQVRKQKDLNIVPVKILSEIPAFVGTDMKDYGPFSDGKETSLPYAVAKLLVSRGLAEMKEGG
jgi:DNA replication initiation complex subunit (GINS family)